MNAAERIVAEALTWTGTPYRHQGARKGVGCDCLGLVRGVWRGVYGAEAEVPGPYAADWAETGEGDPLVAAARRHCAERPAPAAEAGDLLLFRLRPRLPARHCGIALSQSHFLHAYQGHAVISSPLDPHWRRRLCGVFTFPDLRG